MVDFSLDGRCMFSVGYDNRLRVWDMISADDDAFVPSFAPRHGEVVCDNWDTYSSEKAKARPETHTFPSALRFDPYEGTHLLAGFSSNSEDEARDTYGEACVWNVETQQQVMMVPKTSIVFDVAWNPNQRTMPSFAVACKPSGKKVNRETRSVVMLYDARLGPDGRYVDKYRSRGMELDCKALDMNDVVWW